ncbi:MAG: hypothetical protein KDA25_06355 [Phycisphaerales bacterium]|nr:hypothetical protein [Phycisphaerales bacterium]
MGDSRVVFGGLIIGCVFLAISVVAGALNGADGWAQFFRSYLNAFYFVTTIGLGSMFFVLVQHATRAGWSVMVRRLAEIVMANFIILIPIMFAPILIAVVTGHGDLLYDWAAPGAAAHDALLQHKSGFLNVPFWSIRAVAYLAIWSTIAAFYFRTSVAQDASGDLELTHRMQRFAPISIVLFALTLTFAAFDWIMSLEATWFSTMFGVYNFAGACCGFFATCLVVMFLLQRSGRLTNVITLEHYQDVGKLLFGFGIVFWAYIAFSQYMLIWYGNIPEETGWFLSRQVGGWRFVSVVLIVGHFVLPFVAIISKHPKRRPAVIAAVGGWMLLMHYVDLYWLIQPAAIPHEVLDGITYTALLERYADVGAPWNILDLTCLLGVVGVAAGLTLRRMQSVSLVPEQDPRALESVAFENM